MFTLLNLISNQLNISISSINFCGVSNEQKHQAGKLAGKI